MSDCLKQYTSTFVVLVVVVVVVVVPCWFFISSVKMISKVLTETFFLNHVNTVTCTMNRKQSQLWPALVLTRGRKGPLME